MGQKEKLIYEYFALRHKFDVNEGTNCKIVWKPIPTESEIREYKNSYKVIDLEEKVAAIKRSLESQEQKIRVKEYFATEEGTKLKAELEARQVELYIEAKNLKDKYNTILHDKIISVLGNKFTTTFSGSSYCCCMEIGIINTDEKRKGFTFKFGHEFDLRYEKNWCNNNELELSINYGALGSFNGINDEDRIAYIVGFGKFLENNELKNDIINIFKEFMTKDAVISNESKKICNKLNNPFNN